MASSNSAWLISPFAKRSRRICSDASDRGTCGYPDNLITAQTTATMMTANIPASIASQPAGPQSAFHHIIGSPYVDPGCGAVTRR